MVYYLNAAHSAEKMKKRFAMAAPRNENIKSIIIEAAQRLLEVKPLSDISLAEIAREAGVSKGTLYYYYKAKDEILFDITDMYLDRQWREFIEWTDNPEKDTSLHRLVRYVIERNVSTPSMRIHLMVDAMTGNSEVREKLVKRYSEFQKLIADKISERTDKVPAEFFSWLILLTSDGIFLQKLLDNPDFDIDAFIEEITRHIKPMTAK